MSFASWRLLVAVCLSLAFAPTCAFSQESITNRLGMKLNRIAPGRFTMGSPATEWRRRSHEHQQDITISKAFHLAQTEVTQQQWQQVMQTEPWRERALTHRGANDAATCIRWTEAQEFCRKLSKREGRTYRLPTEAEWEYACRAGAVTAFSYGSDPHKITDFAWVGSNTADLDHAYAHPVARKQPNAFGLYDMHGNVWEWCSDWYGEPDDGDAKRKHVVDPKGPKNGTRRVIRGGSWHGSADLCRCANRFSRKPASKLNDLGFRVALIKNP